MPSPVWLTICFIANMFCAQKLILSILRSLQHHGLWHFYIVIFLLFMVCEFYQTQVWPFDFLFFLLSRYFEAQYKIIIIKNGGRLSVNYILVVFMLDHFPVLVPSAGIKCRLSKTINIQLTKRLKNDWFIPLWFHCLVAWSYKLLGSTLNESCL